MISPRKFIIFVLVLATLTTVALAAEVKNIKVGQSGDKAVATYDLVGVEGEKEAEVTVAITIDGVRRPAKELKLTGDFGNAVKVGPGKKIIWDATADLPTDFDGELSWDVQTVRNDAKTNESRPTASAKLDASAKAETTAKTLPTDPVVKVNATVINRGEVEQAMKVFSKQNRMGQQSSVDAIIDQLISAELLYQAGAKLGVDDLDEQVATRMAQGKTKFPNDSAYENALKSSDLTPKALEELIRKDTIINNLVVKEIVPKVSVSDAEAEIFYDDNKDKFNGESGATEFEVVKSRIIAYVKNEKIHKAINTYIAKLKEKAKIEKLP